MSNQTNPNQFAMITCLINPLYLLFHEKIRAKAIEGNFDDEVNIDWRLKVLATEDLRTDSEKHNQIRKIFSHFFWGDFNGFFAKEIPILLITYVFSLHIAIIPELREKFFNNYQGKVPAFTQFLLESMRIGVVNKDQYLWRIGLHANYEKYVDDSINQSFGVFHLEEAINEETMYSTILPWFTLLDFYLSEKNFYFKHFVELRKTPFVSNQPLTLTSFGQGDISKSPSAANSRNRDNYVLLNKTLNAKIIYNTDNYFFSKIGKFHRDTGLIDDEEKFANQLIDLIINCSPASLEPSRPIQKSTRRFKIITVILLSINIGLLSFDILKRGHLL